MNGEHRIGSDKLQQGLRVGIIKISGEAFPVRCFPLFMALSNFPTRDSSGRPSTHALSQTSCDTVSGEMVKWLNALFRFLAMGVHSNNIQSICLKYVTCNRNASRSR